MTYSIWSLIWLRRSLWRQTHKGGAFSVPGCRVQRLSYIFQAGCGWKLTVVCWPKGDRVERSTGEENWCKCIPLTNGGEGLNHIIITLFPTKRISRFFFLFPCILSAFKWSWLFNDFCGFSGICFGGCFIMSFLFDSVESSKYCKTFFWLTNWYTPA